MTVISANIPIIETERLTLREPRSSDLEAHINFATSDRAGFVGGPFDTWSAARGFGASIGHWVLYKCGYWIIEDQLTGRPAGRVGITKAPPWPEPELGWQVYADFEGKGIAFEAAIAARSAAAEHFGIIAPISFVDPENSRSRRLAERLGATVEGEGEIMGHPCLIYRHPQGAA